MNYDAVIIGAGLGGLATATRLASSGYKVLVVEKSDKVGGKLNVQKESGYSFDTGPSLLTMPGIIEELFLETGAEIPSYLEFKKLTILTRYFFPDGFSLDVDSDPVEFKNEVTNKIDSKFKNESTQLGKFLKHTERIYNLTEKIFLNSSLGELNTYTNISALKTFLRIFQLDGLRSMKTAINSFFKSPYLRMIFMRYATYNGSNPYKAPATLNLIAHVENTLGGFYPVNGMYSIAEAIESLAQEKGVEFMFNTSVSEIVTSKGQRGGVEVSGVRVEDANGLGKSKTSVINSKVVVSNADVNYTYQRLLPNDTKLKGRSIYKKLEPSSSVVVFLWGVRGVHQKLDIHNILFTADYENEFKEIFSEGGVNTDPTIYINISSKYRPQDAPKNCENWFVLVNSSCDNGENWDEKVAEIRGQVIKKINKQLKIDINAKIVYEDTITPARIESETSSWKGALYGISSNTKLSAFLRQNNRSREIRGLYFASGSSHPGGGIPLVLKAGKITAALIAKYNPLTKPHSLQK